MHISEVVWSDILVEDLTGKIRNIIILLLHYLI